MNAFWTLQTRRIDALSLRERAIMFVSLAVALVAATDTLVFAPQLGGHKELTQKMRASATERDILRAQLAESGAAAQTPTARLARELRDTQATRRAVDDEIARRLADTRSAPRLPELLERVLRRHDRLTLLRLATMPAPAAPRPGALPLQGVDLGVRGAYLDLTQYVADAEREMPGLRWGELSITSSGDSAELQARVLLLGAAR